MDNKRIAFFLIGSLVVPILLFVLDLHYLEAFIAYSFMALVTIRLTNNGLSGALVEKRHWSYFILVGMVPFLFLTWATAAAIFYIGLAVLLLMGILVVISTTKPVERLISLLTAKI